MFLMLTLSNRNSICIAQNVKIASESFFAFTERYVIGHKTYGVHGTGSGTGIFAFPFDACDFFEAVGIEYTVRFRSEPDCCSCSRGYILVEELECGVDATRIGEHLT